jgi:hypothetical protein
MVLLKDDNDEAMVCYGKIIFRFSNSEEVFVKYV